MRNVLFLRRKLAHRLRGCAARRYVGCAGDPTGQDLKVIALLHRLAHDAEHLPQALVDEVARHCADPAFTRRFEQVWDDTLPEAIGVLPTPGSAADLVRWMVAQAAPGPISGQDGTATTQDRPMTEAGVASPDQPGSTSAPV